MDLRNQFSRKTVLRQRFYEFQPGLALADRAINVEYFLILCLSNITITIVRTFNVIKSSWRYCESDLPKRRIHYRFGRPISLWSLYVMLCTMRHVVSWGHWSTRWGNETRLRQQKFKDRKPREKAVDTFFYLCITLVNVILIKC